MKARSDYDLTMRTVEYGIEVVEALIAARNWRDARHYLASTRRYLASAEQAAAALLGTPTRSGEGGSALSAPSALKTPQKGAAT